MGLKLQGLKGENDLDPVMFGEYEFLDSSESLQYFPVQVCIYTDLFVSEFRQNQVVREKLIAILRLERFSWTCTTCSSKSSQNEK